MLSFHCPKGLYPPPGSVSVKIWCARRGFLFLLAFVLFFVGVKKYSLAVGRADLFGPRRQGSAPAALFCYFYVYFYADELRHPDDKKQRHFILPGVVVFECQTRWLSQELDNLQNF